MLIENLVVEDVIMITAFAFTSILGFIAGIAGGKGR